MNKQRWCEKHNIIQITDDLRAIIPEEDRELVDGFDLEGHSLYSDGSSYGLVRPFGDSFRFVPVTFQDLDKMVQSWWYVPGDAEMYREHGNDGR